MTYPKFQNKHLEEALFGPKDYRAGWPKGYRGPKPTKYVIVYYREALNHFRKSYPAKKVVINSELVIYQYKDLGVVRMTGVGSPHATAYMEELIMRGGREFLNIGAAGGLAGWGTFVCDRAVRDEGTSYHYAAHGDYAYPDKGLTARLERCMTSNGILFTRGANWTIDAPYRETRAEIAHYKKEGVKTVEMEASALFTLAKVRKVKIAAAFVISDVLEEKWDPQFHARHFKKDLYALMDAAVGCLLKR